VRGSAAYPGIRGKVDFYQTDQGVVVLAEMAGLPVAESDCGNSVFGFHIHEGSKCEGNEADPFAEVGQHYNPGNCPHPAHAGDMPPLFNNKGYAIQMFLTDRFTVEEIIGRTVVLHSGPDDFTSQPAGNAGKKIACGVIYRGTSEFGK
jgi:Cu-Zn family superoxide dismutase